MEGVGLSVSVTDLSTMRYTYHSLQERSDIKFRAPHVDGHSGSHRWTNRFDNQEERHPLVVGELSVSPFDGVIGWSRLFHARDQESSVVQGGRVVLERAVESDHRLLPGRGRPKGHPIEVAVQEEAFPFLDPFAVRRFPEPGSGNGPLEARVGDAEEEPSPGTKDLVELADCFAEGDDVLQDDVQSEEHTSELQSPCNLVCRLLLEKKKKTDEQADSTQMNAAFVSHCSTQ